MFGSSKAGAKRGSKSQAGDTGRPPRGVAKGSSVKKAQPSETKAVRERPAKPDSERRPAKAKGEPLKPPTAVERAVPSAGPRRGLAAGAMSSRPRGAAGSGRTSVRGGACAETGGGGGSSGGAWWLLQAGLKMGRDVLGSLTGSGGDGGSSDGSAIPSAGGRARGCPARGAAARGSDATRSGATGRGAGAGGVSPVTRVMGLGAEGATGGEGGRAARAAERGRAAKPRGAGVWTSAVRASSTGKGSTRGGSTSAGSTRGGRTSVGSTSTSSTRGGITSAGSTSAGSTRVDSISAGSTRGGSTRGGSTRGGSTRGGSIRGGSTRGGSIKLGGLAAGGVLLGGGGATWGAGTTRFGTWRVGTRGRCWGRGWTGAGRGDPSAERYIINDNGNYNDDDNEDDDCDDDDNGQGHDDNVVHDEHECNDDYTEAHEDDNDDEDREDDSAEDHDHGCNNEHHDEERGHECDDDDDDNHEDIDGDDDDNYEDIGDDDDDDDDGEGLASAGKEDFVATVPTHPLRKLTPDQVEQVERATRGQSDNEAWFAWRQGRITASVAHSIAHCRYVSGHSDRVPESYLRSLLPPPAAAAARNLRTPALLWGRDMEATAVELYRQTKQRQMNGRYVVRVSPCGLYVDAERPWLAASPDGLVTLEPVAPSVRDLDPSSPSPRSPPPAVEATQRLLLEVKCPYKHRAGSVREAWASDRKFCLDVVEQGGRTSYELKREHSYYTQVQCQLAVSRLLLADFVVYTEEDLAIAPVPFDADFWKQTLERLSTFYDKAVRPLLRPTRPPVEE
uniref:Uncharacterized protein LOC116938369 n=1 Tax=Petromyzon marinus TaxID=7757 RepID=A0AAJ7WKR4_PETMA|nr:uncharacterized protein LOC116938369 [Petromyzon marinus]